MVLRCRLLQISDSTAAALIGGERPKHDSFSSLDIDKAWAGIHYLITGSKEPADDPAFFLLSGFQVPEVSEHVTIHRHMAVAAFQAVLERAPDTELMKKFDAQKMNLLQVYPEEWSTPDLSYLMEYLARLRDFVGAAAKAGFGMVITIM